MFCFILILILILNSDYILFAAQEANMRSQDTRQYTISSLTRQHSGSYMCEAENRAGKTTEEIDLSVQCKLTTESILMTKKKTECANILSQSAMFKLSKTED